MSCRSYWCSENSEHGVGAAISLCARLPLGANTKGFWLDAAKARHELYKGANPRLAATELIICNVTLITVACTAAPLGRDLAEQQAGRIEPCTSCIGLTRGEQAVLHPAPKLRVQQRLQLPGGTRTVARELKPENKARRRSAAACRTCPGERPPKRQRALRAPIAGACVLAEGSRRDEVHPTVGGMWPKQ